MIKDAIAKLAEQADLSEKEAEEALLDILCGSASPVQIAAYLMGLRVKGETVEEIAGSARAMRARASRIRVTDPLVLDTCGTGGDRSGTFNISTAAAFVAAGSGVTVAKHGNRWYRLDAAVRMSYPPWASTLICRPLASKNA